MTESKIKLLQDGADKAYALETEHAEDIYAWFYAQPVENLTALWAIACVQGAAWDDEVFDALDRHGWFDEPVMTCVCAVHADGSVTTFLCPVHADVDPCLTMAQTTGRRRTGTIRRGTCTACGHKERA